MSLCTKMAGWACSLAILGLLGLWPSQIWLLTVKHFTHSRPAPPRNTLLTVDLPHLATPCSPCTCATAEYLTHCGPTSPPNTLITLVLPRRGIPYSMWTFRTAKHPTHRGPTPPRNTQLIVILPHRWVTVNSQHWIYPPK